MISHPGFPVDEIRGRLLFEQLTADALAEIGGQDWSTETAQAPTFPTVARTDTGTMRAVVVAS